MDETFYGQEIYGLRLSVEQDWEQEADAGQQHTHTHIHEQRIFTPYYVRKIIWCSRPLKRQSIIISWCIKSYNNILNIRHFPFGIIENSCFSGNRPIMNIFIRFTGTRKNMYFLRFLERKKNQMPSTIIVVGYAYTIHMYSLYTNTKPRCRRLSKFVFLLHVFFFRCCVDIYTWTFYILIFLLVEEDAIEWSFCRKATFSVPRCYHSFIHSTFSLFLDNTAKKNDTGYQILIYFLYLILAICIAVLSCASPQ